MKPAREVAHELMRAQLDEVGLERFIERVQREARNTGIEQCAEVINIGCEFSCGGDDCEHAAIIAGLRGLLDAGTLEDVANAIGVWHERQRRQRRPEAKA